VRTTLRPLAARIFALAVGAVLPIGWLLPSCGTDAVGVDVCRQIETARCSALLSCPVAQGGFTKPEEVDACTLFYRDQCLHGIQSTTVPTDAQSTTCVSAVKAAAVCAKAGAATLEGCAGAALVPTADPKAIAPCSAILLRVDELAACAFVDAPPDAGTPTPDAATPDADAGGDAASD
jgi:hypothetical protein